MSDDKREDQSQGVEQVETVIGTGTVTGTVAADPVPERDSVDDIVDSWVDEYVRGSPVAQATEAWNHLVGALDHLKAKIREAL